MNFVKFNPTFQQAGKKEGGWGEGIFARLLSFPSRLRKGKAEGGFGGNSAFPFLNQIEASPATLLFKARHHRKILFSLKEIKIRRAQNEKSKEYFSVVWRACRAVAGLASLVWFRSAVSDKMGSSQTVKTHQYLTFFKFTDFLVGGAKRRPRNGFQKIGTSGFGVFIQFRSNSFYQKFLKKESAALRAAPHPAASGQKISSPQPPPFFARSPRKFYLKREKLNFSRNRSIFMVFVNLRAFPRS